MIKTSTITVSDYARTHGVCVAAVYAKIKRGLLAPPVMDPADGLLHIPADTPWPMGRRGRPAGKRK